MPVRIAVDFNTMMMDPAHRVYIAEAGSTRPRDRAAIDALQGGQAVVLYDGEMEVLAIPDFDQGCRVWFGIPDWSTRREPRGDAADEG